MNVKKYLIASIAAAVWLLIYGFVVNGILLADFWSSQGMPELMRPEDEMVVWALLASTLSQGLVLGFIFTRGYEGRGVGEGLRFGLLAAWFLGSIYLLFYAIQPWNEASLVASIVADGLGLVGAGVVLSLLYRPAAP